MIILIILVFFFIKVFLILIINQLNLGTYIDIPKYYKYYRILSYSSYICLLLISCQKRLPNKTLVMKYFVFRTASTALDIKTLNL